MLATYSTNKIIVTKTIC